MPAGANAYWKLAATQPQAPPLLVELIVIVPEAVRCDMLPVAPKETGPSV